jgi:hypothetical protein
VLKVFEEDNRDLKAVVDYMARKTAAGLALISQPLHYRANPVSAVEQASFFVHCHGNRQRHFYPLAAHDAR